MSPHIPEDRRNWFRFFPDGSLEFVVVTRVLALLLMLMLCIVKGTHRTSVFVALCGMLWIDYMLTLFWLIQLATDLGGPSDGPMPRIVGASTGRVRSLLITGLPATFAFAALAPWPAVILSPGPLRLAAARFAGPVLALAFIASLIPAARKARTLDLGPATWVYVMLMPLVHWLGVHRLLRHLDERLSRLSDRSSKSEDSGPTVLAAMADVLWIASILPWLMTLLVAALQGGDTAAAATHRLLPACGALTFGLFSTFDLAAMDRVQKRFLRLVRSP